MNKFLCFPLSKKLQAVAFAIVAASLPTVACAGVLTGQTTLGVKFNTSAAATTISGTYGVPGVDSTNWNLTDGASGTVGSLLEDTGGISSATTATITWSAPAGLSSNIDNNNFGGSPFGSEQAGFMNGYLAAGGFGGNPVTLTISSIPTEFTSSGYSLYIYSVNEVSSFTSIITLVSPVVGTPVTTSSSQSGPTFVEGGNYVVYTGLTASSLSLSISSDTPAGSIQAIELVATVPEPGTYALLGFAGVGIIVLRTRRRLQARG